MVISFYWWIIWRKTSLTITQGINRKSKKDRQYTDQGKWIKGDTMIYNSAYKKLSKPLKINGRTQVLRRRCQILLHKCNRHATTVNNYVTEWRIWYKKKWVWTHAKQNTKNKTSESLLLKFYQSKHSEW
jgi:hypothetical protein